MFCWLCSWFWRAHARWWEAIEGEGRKGGEEQIKADKNSVFEAELQDVIPICHATIAGTRIIGRLTAGYVYAFQIQIHKQEWMGGTLV
jgi:hypothetical protein